MDLLMNGVAKTSLLVAAMRAAESKLSPSEGRLFVDPFAEDLAGAEGKHLLETALKIAGPQPAIAIRTKYFDDQIQEAVQGGIRQIVILAAGMDSRSFRLDFPKDTKIYELDQEAVLNYKNQKLKSHNPHCNRITIPTDLTTDWRFSLKNSGMDSNLPTLWLVEGLLMYLPESAVHELFEKINSLAKSDSILLCDILGTTLLNSPFMKPQLDFLSQIGAPWKFGTDEPESFFKKMGWTANAKQNGEACPSRWPFPMAPRNVPNVPRGFLVVAKK